MIVVKSCITLREQHEPRNKHTTYPKTRGKTCIQWSRHLDILRRGRTTNEPHEPSKSYTPLNGAISHHHLLATLPTAHTSPAAPPTHIPHTPTSHTILFLNCLLCSARSLRNRSSSGRPEWGLLDPDQEPSRGADSGGVDWGITIARGRLKKCAVTWTTAEKKCHT